MACTGCLTALGYAPGCRRTAGGLNSTLYIAQACEVEGLITRDGYDETGKIVAIDPSVVWSQIQARQETLNLTEPIVDNSGAFIPTLTFTVDPIGLATLAEDGRQAALDFVNNITDQNAQWVVIIQEKSGVRRMLGLKNGLRANASTTFDSGTANTDVASETIVLVGGEPEKGPVISASVVLTVV